MMYKQEHKMHCAETKVQVDISTSDIGYLEQPVNIKF